MTESWKTRRPALALGAVVLLLAGAGGGAGAIALTRPSVEMAPTTATPIARLADARGIVTVKGQVEAVFGDRVLVRDATGRMLVDVGPRGGAALQAGAPLTAQGRFDNGQLHVRYLVAADGTVEEVGPPRPPHGPGGPPPHPGDAPTAPPPPPASAAAAAGQPAVAPAAAPVAPTGA